MAENDVTRELRVGDIVEIQDAAGSGVGEVVSLDPVQVAVVHLHQLDASQIIRNFHVSELSWNDLRMEAKKLDIPASGKREELEVKIKQALKLRGGMAIQSVEKVIESLPGSGEPQAEKTAEQPALDVGDCVYVKSRSRAKGRVTEIKNPPDARPYWVKYCHPNANGLREQDFARDDLELPDADDASCPDSDRCSPICGPDGDGCPACWPPKD